ncbi:hypothetical protein BOX15_Mlig025749g1 [Macrostomum lignano]|uniref:Endoplasmic reticulum junction formation protein lunapark n=1 Tax=Macrostomum lignano TaxID=282301 RepID=A0A267EX03_9PLAT|nr:hypothetical protein BOX15_Mlig025749g2 [Macrostomum lignano]PAA89447.1 hypothetical protein BOX15_Mlig025749g1 [Macrostomum lignano]
MGLLLSYFRRPKDSVAELESIEAQLNRLEAWRQNQLRLQKRLLGYLLIAFLIGYPSALGVYYVYCLPVASRLTQLLHVAAFVFVLPLFYALRRFLLWIFVRSLAGCEARASRLREDKRKVLDRVMDTETYKRAKEILDRFDPDRFKAEFQQPQAPAAVKPGQFFAKSSLAKRPPPQQQQPAAPQPQPPQGVVLRKLLPAPNQQQPPPPMQQQPLPRPQLPRPVLSRDRSAMDRIIDLLVGDGADRRYALICRRCCSHNGMAMAEEFPHLAWRCAYCAYLHSPRQPLPNPPVLPLGEASPQPGRPQWQSLTDLRPAASTSAAGAGGEAGREDSSSSAASTPAAAAAGEAADAGEVNGESGDAAAADAEAAEEAEPATGQEVRRRAAAAAGAPVGEGGEDAA